MYTKSPSLISILWIWSSLWSDALLTVVPAKETGSKFATGVIAPVLPTWKLILFNLVKACSALYLYEIAHLGNLEVKPISFCISKLSTLITIPSISKGKLNRSLSQNFMKFKTPSIVLCVSISEGILKPHDFAFCKFS